MNPKPCFIKVLNCRKSVQFPYKGWLLVLHPELLNKMLSSESLFTYQILFHIPIAGYILLLHFIYSFLYLYSPLLTVKHIHSNHKWTITKITLHRGSCFIPDVKSLKGQTNASQYLFSEIILGGWTRGGQGNKS